MVSTIILPLVRLALLAALVKGGFLWLEESQHIYVDRWVATMIGAIESMAVQAPAWVGWTLVGGLGLVGTTIWELIRYRTQRAKVDSSASKEEAPPMFIRARNTIGTRIIGNIFRGKRTHIDAEGATDLEATDNIHEESSTDTPAPINDGVGVTGPKKAWAERRAAPAATATDRWFSKPNIMTGIYALAAIAAAGFFAWFFGG